MNIDKKLISIKESSNSVFSSDILQKYSIESILANPLDRTIWINGMPYGNAFILQGPDNTDNENAPINSEIFNDFIENEALGNYSHSEGRGTQTKNEAEHAEGMWNKSIIGETLKEKTISTIGIGTDNENRRNAFDVRYDGSIFIDGLGGYNTEENPQTLQEIILNIIANPGGVGEFTDEGGEIFNSYGKDEGVERNIAYKFAHGEGKGTAAKGEASHTEGVGTQTFNIGEHAQGNYNKSIQSEEEDAATLSSIGIGDSDENRKNALEVKQNGDIYMYGVANYGDNFDYLRSLNIQKFLELMHITLSPWTIYNNPNYTLVFGACEKLTINSDGDNTLNYGPCRSNCIFIEAMKRIHGHEGDDSNSLANNIFVVDRYAISKVAKENNELILVF